MNKKVFIAFIIAGMLFLLAGCVNVGTTTNEEPEHYRAILLLPDGTVVSGECEKYTRISRGWMYIKINGVEYMANEWRITMIIE